jgi:hypothetical protein
VQASLGCTQNENPAQWRVVCSFTKEWRVVLARLVSWTSFLDEAVTLENALVAHEED